MKKLLVYGVVLLLLLCVGTARADSTFNFDPGNTFSGTAPTGFMTAVFSDVTGGVQLVLASSLGTGENLDPGKAFYFNINPGLVLSLSNPLFALTANTGFSEAATVMTAADAYKADGDGLYDIKFTYASSTKAFTSGQSQTYLITYSGSPIRASDFNYLSEGKAGWYAAMHVQNVSGGTESAWVGANMPVPEGESSIWFTILGMAGVLGLSKVLKARIDSPAV